MRHAAEASPTCPEVVRTELRGAVRYPVEMPAVVLIGGRQLDATTVNVSAGGILLRLVESLSDENGLEFLLELPKEATYDGTTAAIHCLGHVIRTFEQDGYCYLAAVIDDYRFQ